MISPFKLLQVLKKTHFIVSSSEPSRNISRTIKGMLGTFWTLKPKNPNELAASKKSKTRTIKARLNGFNICLTRSTQLLNQMSGAFEQVVQHC